MKKSLLLTLTGVLSMLALGTIAAVSYTAFADTDPVAVRLIRVVPVDADAESQTWTGSNRMVIILQKIGQTTLPSNCGSSSFETKDTYDTIALRPGEAIRLEVSSEMDLKPGDRIENIVWDSTLCCLDSDGMAVSCLGPEAVTIARQFQGELR